MSLDTAVNLVARRAPLGQVVVLALLQRQDVSTGAMDCPQGAAGGDSLPVLRTRGIRETYPHESPRTDR